jgi:hypothetical protein
MSINTNITRDNIKLAYQEMARDKQREKEAREWEEGLIQVEKILFLKLLRYEDIFKV